MQRSMQRSPVQFLRRVDVVDNGEAKGQDGGAVRAHWPRELTTMTTALRGVYCADDVEVGRGRDGARVRLRTRTGILEREAATVASRWQPSRGRSPSSTSVCSTAAAAREQYEGDDAAGQAGRSRGKLAGPSDGLRPSVVPAPFLFCFSFLFSLFFHFFSVFPHFTYPLEF